MYGASLCQWLCNRISGPDMPLPFACASYCLCFICLFGPVQELLDNTSMAFAGTGAAANTGDVDADADGFGGEFGMAGWGQFDADADEEEEDDWLQQQPGRDSSRPPAAAAGSTKRKRQALFQVTKRSRGRWWALRILQVVCLRQALLVAANRAQHDTLGRTHTI